MKLSAILQASRAPFLILSPACVFLGVSTVVASYTAFNGWLLVLVMLAALLAHIAVNTLNEYSDFKSGLDFSTNKTPFSGGSGALPQNPGMASAVLWTGILCCVAVLMIGLFFIWQYGFAILPIGLVGLLIVVTYTDWINKSPLLCLLAPGIGFGFLMVLGTQFALTGDYSTLSWLAAGVPFFLVNNLLLINQFPDIKADSAVGRNHLPVAYGTDISALVYLAFTLAAAGIIIASCLAGLFPTLSLIALLPLPLALFTFTGAIAYGAKIGAHPQYLAANVAVTILTPLLLGIGIFLG